MTVTGHTGEKSIILTGMPGSGKSTVGVLLAKSLGLPFLDTDLLFQCKEGQLLHQYISRYGIEKFLDAEQRVIRGIPPQSAVIATGGSVVLREKSMEHLRSFGTVVFLDVSFAELTRRIRNIRTRGIVIPQGQSFEDVFRHRRPYYQRYADVTVESEGLSTEETLAVLLKKLNL